ncbi:MAG: O-antigen ligase family protein [Limisphaerales bacterium]
MRGVLAIPSSPAMSRSGRLAANNGLRRPQAAASARPLQFNWVLGMLFLHALLGVLFKRSGSIATLHALGTLFFGLYLAISGRPMFQLACWGMYAAGAEVLWRMTGANLVWEYGKYAVSLVLFIRFFRGGLKTIYWTPVIYFILLMPAVLPTILGYYSAHGFGDARKLLSFNLSGPLSLLACSLFFSRVHLTDLRTRRMLVWMVLPVAGIAGAILSGLTSLEHLEFSGGSSIVASGGFGPNQVSGFLGMGAFFAALLALDTRLKIRLRMLFLALALWFAAHAALSFSRTGIYLFGAGLAVALPFSSIRNLLRPKTLLLVALAVGASLVTWAFLMRYTEGKIGERFSNTSLTRRDLIAAQDIALWKQNVILGAGVGSSSIAHSEGTAGRIGAHTEYTRLLAEHGLLGAMAVLLLLKMAARPLFTMPRGLTKGALLGATAMTLIWMAASAMRNAAPGLLLGLAAARFSRPRPRILRQPAPTAAAAPLASSRPPFAPS